MSDFREQIKEDIRLIQKEYGYIDDKIQRDEYAFNYWVLSRLYSLDEEIISSYVTDVQDKGIDCFVHYEDTKELKYYNDSTNVDRNDVADFLNSPLSILMSGNYKRSEELQRIFDRVHSNIEYHLQLN